MSRSTGSGIFSNLSCPVRIHEGHGLKIFSQFCEELTEEKRDAIKVVAGDGARWIDECVKQYFKQSRRCIDFFHAVEWVNETLDKAKNSARRQAEDEVEQLKKEFKKAEKNIESAKKYRAKSLKLTRRYNVADHIQE